MDHLFFNCELAKRVWRASHLGFNFEVLHQTLVCEASSATLVEIWAGLLLLQWVLNRNISNVLYSNRLLSFCSASAKAREG